MGRGAFRERKQLLIATYGWIREGGERDKVEAETEVKDGEEKRKGYAARWQVYQICIFTIFGTVVRFIGQ